MQHTQWICVASGNCSKCAWNALTRAKSRNDSTSVSMRICASLIKLQQLHAFYAETVHMDTQRILRTQPPDAWKTLPCELGFKPSSHGSVKWMQHTQQICVASGNCSKRAANAENEKRVWFAWSCASPLRLFCSAFFVKFWPLFNLIVKIVYFNKIFIID